MLSAQTEQQALTSAVLADSQAREAALDPTQSFIVQAPAGSGKTGLLVQRFLVLLSRAEKVPEECLSITFTRKAATEMKERVLLVLQAGTAPYPDKGPAFVQKNWHLAQAVLKRDAALGWHLLENSTRLQIKTIDALCARIVRQMPLLSGFGVLPEVADDPDILYEQAAMRLLESPDVVTEALQHVLVYLDNDSERLKKLLMSLLPRRDQWLPYLLSNGGGQEALYNLRAVLEKGLQSVIVTQLEILKTVFEPISLYRLAPFAVQAATVLQANNTVSPIVNCLALSERLPQACLKDLSIWQGIAELLLTKEGGWRKQVTAQQGFLAPSQVKDTAQKKFLSANKVAMLAFVEDIKDHAEGEVLQAALVQLRDLPAPQYSETEWGLTEALFQLLPMLVAQLTVIFQETGKVDFVEINMAANRALGDADVPSELLLHLDARLRHILVDEFQDTSRAQCRLLEKLTAGWQSGDGRTIFLVGDPMQSIYRFRQAEVGLFLQAVQTGIGDVALTTLNLSLNFRSAQAVVEWNNRLYEKTFPAEEDVSMGAVRFWSSVAHDNDHGRAALAGVTGIIQAERDDKSEAAQVLEWIQITQRQHPKRRIAILVRTRAHLSVLLPTLAAAGIAYTGVDIETLGGSVIVRDLMTVTRALYYLADRVAWLALLRMPWCCISLADLDAIVRYADKKQGKGATIWSALLDTEVIPDLSMQAVSLLQTWLPLWSTALMMRDQYTLRDSIENIWVALGGEVYYRARFSDYEVISSQYYDLLDTPAAEEWLLYPAIFEEKIGRTFRLPHVPATTAYPPVMVMTLHKAKGLEFDTVILPGLGKTPLKDKKQLLLWGEHVNKQGDLYHLFAPIVKGKTSESPIYKFLQSNQEKRLQLEALRLLYVATTRAKKQLYWIGHVKDEKPQPNSLLSIVWSALRVDHLTPF
jgi:ATP-dependent exoDNAse (exonuclease V) beta subunit